MTQVDFYILEDDAPLSRERLLCRLSEKILSHQQQVHIHSLSAKHSGVIDDLLWTYRVGSFIPHALYQDGMGTPPPVLISHEIDPAYHTDVLINLGEQVPLYFSRFARVAEIINQHPASREQGRKRYRFYKDRGYTLKSHTIAAQSA